MTPDQPTLIIENGRIIDGLGNAPKTGHVAVAGERIVSVGAGDAPANASSR